MLKHITFKAGSSPSQPPLSFDLEPSVTIFVGPNNAGKSTALSELQNVIGGRSGRIVDSIDVEPMTESEAIEFISKLRFRDHSSNQVLVQGLGDDVMVFDRYKLQQQLTCNSSYRDNCGTFAATRVRFVLGGQRTNLLAPQQWVNLSVPSSEFGYLLMEPIKCKSFRDVVAQELGLHIGFDVFSQGGLIHMYFGKTPVPDELSFLSGFIEWRS